ncbi:MAG: alcohol dehydrogenase catalytic domain-containing protein [Clostridia bacterium]|nr:alcohol dehydrogenase catalytic domain-containing protein [Clostridia bacterium]
MRAVQFEGFGGAEVLRVVDLPQPVPERDGVVVRVRAAGVCYHDVINRRGHFPRTMLPAVIGHEVAGEVAAVGAGVEGLREGDRVVVFPFLSCGRCRFCVGGRPQLCRQRHLLGEGVPGGYAEYVAVPARNCLPLPAGIPFEAAAAIPCAMGTALHALRARAGVQLGETVLITGASGGVGVFAVQLARRAGARVLAVTSSPHKEGSLLELGAHDVIVSPDLDFADEVRRRTAGEGVDVVLEIVGAAAFPASVRSLRAGGRLVLIGNLAAAPVEIRPALFILKEMALLGSDGFTPLEVEECLALAAAGEVRVPVARTLPLAEAEAAHRLLEERGATGRVVLVP